jgi:hypothetical protein
MDEKPDVQQTNADQLWGGTAYIAVFIAGWFTIHYSYPGYELPGGLLIGLYIGESLAKLIARRLARRRWDREADSVLRAGRDGR